MLALLQRGIAIGLGVLLTVWVAYFLAAGEKYLAAVGPLFLLAGYAGTLGLEFALLFLSFPPSDRIRPTWRELLAAWLLEVLATPRIFLWDQPFRSTSIPDNARTTGLFPRRGVVLVHGFVCNRGVWNSWLRRLQREGAPFVAPDLEPVFGSIDQYIAAIDRSIDEITAATGLAPVVVGHSMGGLAIRACLARTGPARCHAVVTIGSPHLGTRMARHSTARNGREMRIGSDWLSHLELLEAAAASDSGADARRSPPFVCFWSHCDNIVIPSRNATLAAADNRHLEATPHVQMIHHPAVIDEVLRLVSDRLPENVRFDERYADVGVSTRTPRRT